MREYLNCNLLIKCRQLRNDCLNFVREIPSMLLTRNHLALPLSIKLRISDIQIQIQILRYSNWPKIGVASRTWSVIVCSHAAIFTCRQAEAF